MRSEHREPPPSGLLPHRLFLLGAGGHASVVLDMLFALGLDVEGVVDKDLGAGDTWEGIPVIGNDDVLAGSPPGVCALVNGLGANPDVCARNALFARFRRAGFSFPSLVHPSAVIARNAAVGSGTQVMAGAVLQGGSSLGENCVVNTRAVVEHHCRIADGVFVGPGAVLCGDAWIGEDVFIGAGAVVLPGIHVGRGSVVGAGAVVLSPVSGGVIVAGNPARVLRRAK